MPCAQAGGGGGRGPSTTPTPVGSPDVPDAPVPNSQSTTASVPATPPQPSAEVLSLLALRRGTPPRGFGLTATRATLEADVSLVGLRSPLYRPTSSPVPAEPQNHRMTARDRSLSPHSPMDAPPTLPQSTCGDSYVPSGSVAGMVGSAVPSIPSPVYSGASSPPRDDRSVTSSYMSSRALWILDGVLDDLLSLDNLPGTVRWIRARLRDCIDYL